MMFKSKSILFAAVLTALAAAPAVADQPVVMRHWHDASGHLVWRYTHDWQIVRSLYSEPRPVWVVSPRTYAVYHNNQLVERTSSLAAARRVVAGR